MELSLVQNHTRRPGGSGGDGLPGEQKERRTPKGAPCLKKVVCDQYVKQGVPRWERPVFLWLRPAYFLRRELYASNAPIHRLVSGTLVIIAGDVFHDNEVNQLQGSQLAVVVLVGHAATEYKICVVHQH